MNFNWPKIEWDETVLAEDYKHCPKCGTRNDKFAYRYQSAGIYEKHTPCIDYYAGVPEPCIKIEQMIVPEHVRVECLKCKYHWNIKCLE
jgi:hypothetical protein